MRYGIVDLRNWVKQTLKSRARKTKGLKDTFSGMHGFLEIESYNHETGERKIVLAEERNIITDGARMKMPFLISGDDIATDELWIKYMAWGDAGIAPAAPTAADTQLINETLRKTVTHDFPTTTSVRFSADILTSELNGTIISEEGLFNAEPGAGPAPPPTMYARKTFGGISKTSAISLTFRHTIAF